MFGQKQKWFFVFLLLCTPTITHARISLVEWTFPLAANDNTTADGGIFDNLTQKISAIGTGTVSFLSSGFISTNGWNSTVSEKYWLIPFSSLGYHTLSFSFEISGSNTGPRDFIVQYRIGEDGEWQIIPSSPPLQVTTTNETFDFSLPETTSNQASVFIRLLLNGNTSVNGSTIGTSGSSRLDNIFIQADLLSDPEEETPEIPLCTGAPEAITISEILPAPKTDESEYVELHNSGEQCVELSNWSFQEKTAGGSNNPPYYLPENTIIEGASYLTFFRNFSLNNSGDTLTLFDNENEERSSVSYSLAIKDYSYSFTGSEWLFTSFQTPGAENIFDQQEEEAEALPGSGVILNEIFPNPPQDEAANEFIELKNITNEEKDLIGWGLMDASQKIFTFSENTLIAPNAFLSIPRSIFSFSLNNTGTETITLLDPQGNTLSEVEYSSTQENFSYGWNGSNWQWTKKTTPGKENEFSKNPKVTLVSDTTGYKDIPLTFKITIKNGKGPYKYSWDFGDGRRSTLAEPKHTFTKTGDYKGTIMVRGENGTAQKDFTINIKKYPSYPVLITALHPNPSGTDTGKEWIEIKNFSNKKIDLTGWSIASGSEELTNHPVTPGIILVPNQSLRLTRSHASFSLVNSSGAVELRYPNKKSSSHVEYQEKEVPEDSTCLVINERCDFPNDTKKSTAASPKTAKNSDEKIDTKQNHDALIEGSKSPDSLPTKKEILQRIGTDFNLLMNQVLSDSFFRE